jgi:glycosyltransferase involved in cell wall biosynthesis
MLKLAIKNPAPDDDSQKNWGDFHFGKALQASLEARGVTVFHDFQPNWSVDHQEDVVLVLRGLSNFKPVKAKFNILWIISHPALVSSEELDAYDLVLTVSAFHRSLLCEITKTPVEVARQCTDFGKFPPAGGSLSEEAATREGIVYVANSRGQRREMAQWINETNTRVRVFGRAWEKFGIGHLVEKEYIPNSDLPELYRSARLCLNDHWKDMRAFGFINNRIFDSLACGLPLLTDSFPEIQTLFGDALLYARNAEDFKNKLAFCESNYEEVLGRVREKWNEIGLLYTFDARAQEFIQWIQSPPTRNTTHSSPDARIHQNDLTNQALLEFVAHEEEKTAYLEKLISDQTRLADQARREAAWAREQREEEKRAKEEFRERTWKEIKELKERISAQEQAKYQLLKDLKSVNEELSGVNYQLQKEKNIRADVENRLQKERTIRLDAEARFQKEKNIRISLFDYAKSLRNELETIYKSRSWKIGAPYRFLARAIYGLLRGKKMGKARIPDWPPSIAELNKPGDASHDASKSQKSPKDAAQQLPTGSLQNPVFADQIFGASERGSKPEAALPHSRMPVYWQAKRFPRSMRHHVQQFLLPIKRRLSGPKTRALREWLPRVRAANSAIATQHPSAGRPQNSVSDLTKHSGSGMLDQPLSLQAERDSHQSAGYWHDKAMQLLIELESIQVDAGLAPPLLPDNIFQKHALRGTAAASNEAEGGDDCESAPHLKNNLEYWRDQALQLHEEIEFAKANFLELQG